MKQYENLWSSELLLSVRCSVCVYDRMRALLHKDFHDIAITTCGIGLRLECDDFHLNKRGKSPLTVFSIKNELITLNTVRVWHLVWIIGVRVRG